LKEVAFASSLKRFIGSIKWLHSAAFGQLNMFCREMSIPACASAKVFAVGLNFFVANEYKREMV